MRIQSIVGTCAAVLFMSACTSTETKVETAVEEVPVETAEEEVHEAWVVHETGFGDVSLHHDEPETESMDEGESEIEPIEAKPVARPISHELFQERIKPVTYIAGDPLEVEIALSTVPLSETETITAYNSHGKEKGTIEVIHDSESGEIVSVTYTHKDHKDQYDISPGMSAKDVKEIRKDLKHMKHRGEYFLYSDVSNIMYVLDVSDNKGHEMTEIDFDQVEVDAIVWKDKKHHNDIEILDFEIEE